MKFFALSVQLGLNQQDKLEKPTDLFCFSIYNNQLRHVGIENEVAARLATEPEKRLRQVCSIAKSLTENTQIVCVGRQDERHGGVTGGLTINTCVFFTEPFILDQYPASLLKLILYARQA